MASVQVEPVQNKDKTETVISVDDSEPTPVSEPPTFRVSRLWSAPVDSVISVVGRIQTCRGGKSRLFIILRDGIHTFQVMAVKKMVRDRTLINTIRTTPKETMVRITGTLRRSAIRVEAASFHDLEMDMLDCELLSVSTQTPIEVELSNLPDDAERGHLQRKTKLDHRYLDLRAELNQIIFRVSSRFESAYRWYLEDHGFMSMHTPKLIGTASESGAEVFKVNYFGRNGFLAQSPQLYKQMMINSDFHRVYEVGPVFRAENCIDHRHLCEFTGLDMEMEIEHGQDYHSVLDMIWNTLRHSINHTLEDFDERWERFKKFREFTPPVIPEKPFILNFKDGVEMLRSAGVEQEHLDDLNTANEKMLGKLVKEKYGTDLFILDRFPTVARPFYTMVDPEDPDYTFSYDIIFRGEEISSGAQRVHDYNTLVKRAADAGNSYESMAGYLDSFKYGSKPHAGCGIGLERVVMLLLQLDNLRQTSLFPRDPKRLAP